MAYSDAIKSGTSFSTPRSYPHTYPKKMATHGQMNQQSVQLCDYCHQKPKFSNHKFCSKTCATQAGGANSNMCTQCHKKPKFQNFDFCGKTCAAQAPQRRNGSGGTQRGRGNNIATTQQPTQPQAGFNAMQLAQMVAQHVPQVKAFLAGVNSATGGPAAPAPAPQQFPVAPVPQNSAPFVSQNNPFLQPQQQQQQQQQQVPQQSPLPAMNGTLAPSSRSLPNAQQSSVSPQPAADDAECLIPGCGKPVHTDAKGLKTSDYCSKSHREEAVASGIADACIMCLTFPQSGADYFCSKTCREEAMGKLPQ